MKKLIPALLIVAAIPAGLMAYSGTYGKNNHSYGRQQQYSTIYDYDSVNNENSVDHYVTQDDKRIAKDIRNILLKSNLADPNDVQIFVEYGKVILEGKTDTNDHRQAVEDGAGRVQGVRNVVNGLYVDNRPMQKQMGTQDKQYAKPTGNRQ